MRECRDLLEHDLGEFFEELGPVIAEEVLALIDATRDDAKKSEYLRVRSDVQNRWEKLTAACREELARQAQPAEPAETSPGEAPGLADLQIVDDKALAEQILAREFVGRVSEACSEETYALDRRIGHLTGCEQPDHRLGPAAVCAAVRAAAAAFYADLDQQSLLLRQLERHLRSELPHLYRAINQVLIEADVLPNLKRSYRAAVPQRGQDAAADANNIMDTLQRLAQARSPGGGQPAAMAAIGGGGAGGFPGSGGGGAGGFPGAGGGDVLPAELVAGGAALFESLQTLQASPEAASGGLTNVLRLARDSGAARQVLPLEAITLDIVAMLFDLIFDDDKVPNPIKGLVSRVQIPILKVAISDPRFFADRSHPARRFLDSISGIAIRWGQTVDENDPFYVKLSELVGRIQTSFGQDADIFGTAITELAAFVSQHEEMEKETSRVVAEIVQRKNEELALQREQNANARQAANAALAPLLAAGLPKAIEQFLLDHWRDVLQNHALASGIDSPGFRDAERVAAELVGSISQKGSAEERKRQVARLPKLLGELNQGLDRIGTSAEARSVFMNALMALHLTALRSDRAEQIAEPEPAAPAPVPQAVQLSVTHSVESGVRIEEVSLPERDAAAEAGSVDRASLRQVKHLVRGDWIEFVDDDGQSRRERLTWISPNRSLLLFSNHAAKCAISITPEALAHRLQTETARLVGRETPLFERALDGAIKALDQAAPSIAA